MRDFSDAVLEASFRAAITGRRYRIRYDMANKLWTIIEQIAMIKSWTVVG